jgi:hypothetical protein
VGPRAGLDSGKSRPTGIRSTDRPARSQSLYRLSYPAHTKRDVPDINVNLYGGVFGRSIDTLDTPDTI